MREWCGCGAAVRARRRDVLIWREERRHPAESGSQVEHAPTSGGSQVEHAWQPIGFRPDAG